MENTQGKLNQAVPYKGLNRVFIGNGESLKITRTGKTILNAPQKELKLNKKTSHT